MRVEGWGKRLFGGLEKILSADLRSLAVTRIAVASIILLDLCLRARDLTAHYTDDGVFPRDAFLDRYQDSWRVSLHLLNGRPEVQAALFAIAGCFALALLVGYRTRLATALSFVLLVSLQARNPLVINGGDELLVLVLLWGNFVPWGARFSLDAAAQPEAPATPRVFSIGTAALLLQMPVVYFFTALLKDGPEWRQDFTAVAYSVRAGEYATAFGRLLSELPVDLLKLLCAGVIALEFIGPLLLLSPFRTTLCRAIGLISFAALQAGFGVALVVGLFPLVSTAALLPFVPGELWNRIRLPDHVPAATTLARTFSARRQALKLSPVAAALCLSLFGYGVLDNLGSVGAPLHVPDRLQWVGSMFRVYQEWSMFAPGPPLRTRWVLVEGELADGRRIDLFTGQASSFDRPEKLSEKLRTARWRKYFGNVAREDTREQLPWTLAWLCRTWNERRSGADQATEVRLYGLHQWSELDRAPEAPVHELLRTRDCDGVEPLEPLVQGDTLPQVVPARLEADERLPRAERNPR